MILGADINYLDKKGYPPLKINGKMLLGGEISLEFRILVVNIYLL